MRSGLVIAISLSMFLPAFAAGTAAAQPATAVIGPTGYVDFYVGGLSANSSGSNTGWDAGVTGQLNYPVDAYWNLQGGLSAAGLWANGSNLHGFGGAMHFYWRDPNRYAIGGFAALTGYGGNNGIGNPYDFTAGPEGQVYLGHLTLYGQAYYGQLRGSGVSLDDLGVRGIARYFMQPNLRLDGELAYRNLSQGGVSNGDFAVAVQANYRFQATPWTVFGRYQFDNLSGLGTNVGIHDLMVGLRYSFGTGTLFDEDRQGATMSTPHNLILY